MKRQKTSLSSAFVSSQSAEDNSSFMSSGDEDPEAWQSESNDSDSSVEEESKFQKYGGKIRKMLDQELLRKRSKNVNVANLAKTRLFYYQIEAVKKTAEYFQSEKPEGVNEEYFKKALIVAPPGSGKSWMVAMLPYYLSSKKVLVLTPSKIISVQLAEDFGYGYQTSENVVPFFQKCGLYPPEKNLAFLLERVQLVLDGNDGANMGGLGSNLVIINAQKFAGNSRYSLSLKCLKTEEEREKVEKTLDLFDTIIVDEAHHYPAATWVNIVERFKSKKVIFLTATPFRGPITNEIPLSSHSFINTVYEIKMDQLEGIKIRKLEFCEKPDSGKCLLDPIFLNQLKNDIQEICTNHQHQEPRTVLDDKPQALILVKTKMEAKEVADKLGSNATYIISDSMRDINLEKYSKGEKSIAVVCGLLKEGYDNSNITLVVILRKVKSRMLFEQFCGRCMRMRMKLTGKNPDLTVGTVLSYSSFDQRKMWDARTKMAEVELSSDDE